MPAPPPIERSLEGSASGIVFTTGKPRIFSLPELEALPDSTLIRSLGIRSACSVPLATAHGILGTLDLGAFADNAFSADQFPLLTRVAGQIAIAVRNAMSYQRHRGAQRAARAREAVPGRRDSQRSSVRGDHRAEPRAAARAPRDRDGCADRTRPC
jgi:GAF domain-containing protein